MNVPLIKVLEQMPGYSKFMKNIITKKRTVSYEPVDNLHHCSVIAMRSLVQKKSNSRAFTILCTIADFSFVKALCDFELRINLISLAVYQSWVWKLSNRHL